MADYVSITRFGAVGDGTTDNTTAIQDALNYAAAHDMAVLVPAGVFAHSGVLTDNGVALLGEGTGSVLKATNGATEAIILTGNGGSITNLQLDGTGSTRLVTGQTGVIWANGATNYAIENVLINGSSSSGIMSWNSNNGIVANNTVENTLADGINASDGSHNIIVTGNRILNAGDDGISIVSYGDLPIVHDITETGNTIIGNNWGRGMSVVGGQDISISGNHIEGGTAERAGIYIAAECEFNTLGVNNVSVTGNTLINAGGSPDGSQQGAITVYNSQGGDQVITDVTISGNQIVNPLDQAIQFVGNGAEAVDVSGNTAYTTGSSVIAMNNPAANVTSSNNSILAPSSYTLPLVAPGGGVGSDSPRPGRKAALATLPDATSLRSAR